MKKRRDWFLLGMFALVVMLNLLSRYSAGFGDKVRLSIFQATQLIQGQVSSAFPFSLGEILLCVALLVAVGAIAFSAVCFARMAAALPRWRRLAGRVGGEGAAADKGARFRRLAKGKLPGYFRVLLWTVAVVSLIMSINCFALYHCSSFSENYMPGKGRDYSVEELAIVRNYVVDQCNALAREMARDEAGDILYAGDIGRRGMQEMRRLGESYPLLAGYYPTPKKLAFSGFFSQQYILGYYFPFSMEANYNKAMYIANVPATVCHELSHVKGFLYEDDANFIGFLACVTSDDAFFRYSGYLSVLDYLNGGLYESLGGSREAYLAYEQCGALVEHDKVFLKKETWEEVERKALLPTETVRQASYRFLETNLQVNGVKEGIASYGKVVEQLLAYYDGVLYGRP